MQSSQKHNIRTILFVVGICFTCALILSILASVLKTPQKDAKELYKVKQLLIAAKMLNVKDEFTIKAHNNIFIPATYDSSGEILVPWKEKTPPSKAKDREILDLYQKRIIPMLTDDTGNLFTFEERNLDFNTYIRENEKFGFADLPYKLLYLIKPNIPSNQWTSDMLPYGYGIPINGYGLWDAIYGFLALNPDADTIIGITWYDQQETPGLGGNISLPAFQNAFRNKRIFKEDQLGRTNFELAPIGIRILKTTVKDELGNIPAAKSAVDGIAGATITSNSVTEALRDSLTPYRAFFIKAHEKFTQSEEK